ncbi:MAG: ComF family protein [Muribaculaceae bacterium]|nr:ComF family protein [Muribaculaceae bacterium]
MGLLKHIKIFSQGVADLLYPARCHLCGADLTPAERFVCIPCVESLPRTGYHRSFRNPMESRFAGQFPFVTATGHFFYSRDSSLAELIQDMKYRNFPSIGNRLGEIAGEELFLTGFLSEIDCVVPLPMHYLKKAKRGYNQTDRIAEGICKASGLELIDALKMTRQRKTQTSLTATQRVNNATDLFAPRPKIDLNGRGVLLVDDICTTGATMGSAAKALTDAFPDIRLYLFALGVTF